MAARAVMMVLVVLVSAPALLQAAQAQAKATSAVLSSTFSGSCRRRT